MPTRRPEEEIARLYRLPLDEFIAARNALAKEAGSESATVRNLVKPPLPAWVVNQVYWNRRPVYDALIADAEKLRAAHKAVLAGRGGDVRAAAQAHEARIEAATAAALSILSESGHPVTDATKQAIVTTLRALPVQEPPGRLTRTLQPGGFEMLAGLAIGRGAARVKVPPPAPPKAREKAPPPAPRANAAALARSREVAAALERKIREAEHKAKREEFELARATREADRAEKTAAGARKALEDARQALEDAEAAVAATARTRESAERRASQAEQTLRDLTKTRVGPGS